MVNALERERILYFYAPVYKNTSAGIITIYKIIDILNNLGIKAYVVLQNESVGSLGNTDKHDYNAPMIDRETFRNHIATNAIPIVVYPDTVTGNPLGAPNICRLLLYYDAMLTGKSCLESCLNEGVIYFSNSIKKHADIKNCLYQDIISFPIADKIVINSRLDPSPKHKVCYYDSKFTSSFRGRVPNNIKSLIKITRDKKDSLNKKDLVSLIKDSKLIHVFEDTALIYESLLLGCPVNLHPDGYFHKKLPLVDNEVKLFGTISKRNVTEDDINQAKNNLKKFKSEYVKWSKNGLNDVRQYLIHLKRHNHSFNEIFTKKIEDNIGTTLRYNDQLKKELNNKLSSIQKINISTTGLFIKILYQIYKILCSVPFINNKARNTIKYIYNKLPTKIKNLIVNSMRRINSSE